MTKKQLIEEYDKIDHSMDSICKNNRGLQGFRLAHVAPTGRLQDMKKAEIEHQLERIKEIAEVVLNG